MSQVAHKSGSPFPELKPGTLRIYSARLCPYAERARLVLAHKNIPHEVVNVDLKDKPEWFLARAPQGKVPVLEIDGKVLYESTAVSEYLDDTYPGERLQASDPMQKAQDRIMLEYFGQVTSAHYGILFAIKDETKKEQIPKNIELLYKHFAFYEENLGKRGGPFFAGPKPGMIDFYLWPHLERIPAVTVFVPEVKLSESMFPNLSKWWNAMSSHPTVVKCMFSREWHVEVFKLLLEGKPASDYGLEE